MGGRIGILGLVVGAMLLPCFTACDDLSVPPAPPGAGEGGVSSSSSSSGGTTTAELFPGAPAGAVAVEKADDLYSTLYTWYTMGPDGKTATVGFTIPTQSVERLNGAPFDARHWVAMPDAVKKDTAITGLAYDFLSHGHVPKGVYDVGHWEFRVILQDLQEVENIDCKDTTLPPDSIIPQGWAVLPPPDNCYLAMGIHAFSFLAPEFNGQRFVTGNLLVYYKGNGSLANKGSKITSYEPKATVDRLLQRQSFKIDLPDLLPDSLGRATRVPKLMTYDWNDQYACYVITLQNFVDAT